MPWPPRPPWICYWLPTIFVIMTYLLNRFESWWRHHLPFCELMTLQLTSHDQWSILAWRAWQAAQFTRLLPVLVASTTVVVILLKKLEKIINFTLILMVDFATQETRSISVSVCQPFFTVFFLLPCCFDKSKHLRVCVCECVRTCMCVCLTR